MDKIEKVDNKLEKKMDKVEKVDNKLEGKMDKVEKKDTNLEENLDKMEVVDINLEEKLLDSSVTVTIPEPPSSTFSWRTVFCIIFYTLCSSTMLIINKVAIYNFPYPVTLLILQLMVSALSISLLGMLGFLEVESLDWDLIRRYWGVVVVFLCNIVTNIKSLEYSNVETVIVFRTCTTLAIAFGDYKYLQKGIPNMRALSALILIVMGALGYVMTDSTFKINSYLWITLYFFCQCAEVLYTKYIVESVPMSSWGRSYYNNTLALLPLGMALLFVHERHVLYDFITFYPTHDYIKNLPTILIVVLSCVAGLLLSLAGFMCRESVTATSFSVIGNMNKILTVIINCFIWDKHASELGLLSLSVCLVSGALYSHFNR